MMTFKQQQNRSTKAAGDTEFYFWNINLLFSSTSFVLFFLKRVQ